MGLPHALTDLDESQSAPGPQVRCGRTDEPRVIDPKEKRIGRRRQIPSVPMTWCSNPRKAPRCRDDKRIDGRVVEVSVTGAGLIARTLPNVEVGDVVAIHCLDLISPVVIRRIDLDLYPGESFYGIELLEGAQPLADELRRRFLDTSPSGPLEFQPRS